MHPWMLRYDLDMSTCGVPGLNLMTRCAKGIEATPSNAGGAT